MLLLKLLSGFSWSQFGNYLFRAFALGVDVVDAPTQDAIAESLMAPLESPTEAVENPAEEQVVEESAEQSQEQEEIVEEQVEETADDWLPTEQEKVFSPETLARLAPRFGFTAEDLSDPRLARLLNDKINSDVYIQQLAREREQAQLAEETAKPEPTRQEQKTEQPTLEQHIANIRTMVQQRTDPAIAKDFFTGFNKIFGVKDEDIAATLKSNPNAPMEFTTLMSTYALNLFNTFVPDMVWSNLQGQIDQIFPNFGQMYERASYAHTWDSIRNSSPQFAELPDFGSKEFSKAARQAAAEQFGSAEDFENALFTKVVNGQRVALTPAENTQKKYSLLASAMLGRKTDPAVVAQAIQTGKKQAARAAVKRDAGTLGSGRSKQQIAQPEKDDLFDQGMELYRQEHGRL